MRSSKTMEQKSKLPEMDGLRGVACLIVLVLHAVALLMPETQGALSGIPRTGVWLFFVLSAFLLTLGLMQDGGLRPIALAAYVRNRILRIYPALIVALLICLLFGRAAIYTATDVLGVMFFQYGPNHFWTIPTELLFYAGLPFILMAMIAIERSPLGRLGALASLAALILLVSALYPPHLAPEGPLNPLWFPVPFGAGIAAAYIWLRYGARLPQWSGYLAIAGIAATMVVGRVTDVSLVDKHYVFGPLWAIVVLSVYGVRSWPRWSWLVWVGEAAFSTYLIHWAVIEFAVRATAGASLPVTVLAGVCSIAVSLVLGRAGFKQIEGPVYANRNSIWPGDLSRQVPINHELSARRL